MGTAINTNTTAFQATLALNRNTSSLSNDIEQLSTGMQINSAADNPAGLVISQNMQGQLVGSQRFQPWCQRHRRHRCRPGADQLCDSIDQRNRGHDPVRNQEPSQWLSQCQRDNNRGFVGSHRHRCQRSIERLLDCSELVRLQRQHCYRGAGHCCNRCCLWRPDCCHIRRQLVNQRRAVQHCGRVFAYRS